MIRGSQKTFDILRQVYPLYALLMIGYGQLVIAMVDYNLFRLHESLVYLCWIPLLMIPYLITRLNVFYYLIIAAIFLDGFFILFHITTTKELPITYSLIALAETNKNESIEFLSATSNYFQLLILPYLLISFFSFRNPPPLEREKTNIKLLGIISLISFSVMVIIIFTTHLKKMILPYNLRISLELKAHNELFRLFDGNRSLINTDAKISNNKENIFVLIIGESNNRNHQALYGYKRNTTPKLGQRSDIFVFKDVVSPYAVTVPAVLTILSESNMDNRIPLSRSINLIDIFHSVGHTTYWLSNQEPRGIWNNAITNLSKLADSSLFYDNEKIINYVNTTRFDETLIEPLKTILESGEGSKFVIMHLMGNHMEYNKRYPSSFELFKSGSSSKNIIIDEYDNSILYNDYMVDSVFNILDFYSRHNPESIVSSIYLSDHGENVYDEIGKLGHDYVPPYTRSEVEIPFIVWLSPKYKSTYADKLTSVELNTKQPFMSDDLYNSVIDLNNIRCSNYDSSRSVFNESYNYKRSRVLGDGQIYRY